MINSGDVEEIGHAYCKTPQHIIWQPCGQTLRPILNILWSFSAVCAHLCCFFPRALTIALVGCENCFFMSLLVVARGYMGFNIRAQVPQTHGLAEIICYLYWLGTREGIPILFYEFYFMQENNVHCSIANQIGCFRLIRGCVHCILRNSYSG